MNRLHFFDERGPAYLLSRLESEVERSYKIATNTSISDLRIHYLLRKNFWLFSSQKNSQDEFS